VSDSRDTYLEPYRKAVAAHGASFEATLWASREFQEARFDVICALCDCKGKVVLDAGAGQGDFALHLKKRGMRPARYIGLEAMPAMAASGDARKLKWTEFHVIDFAAREDAFERFAPDVVVFSGSLNTFEEDAALDVVDRAWRACKAATIFNFLSSAASESLKGTSTGPAKRFDPIRLTTWALERTAHCALRHDYIPRGHDATIAMYRPAER